MGFPLDKPGLAVGIGDPGCGRRRHVAAMTDAAPNSALLETLAVAVYTTDVEGRLTYYNPAAAELWGHRPALGEQEWGGSWRLLWPDGQEMAHSASPTAKALRERRALHAIEVVAERADGTRIELLCFASPLWDERGEPSGCANALVDVGSHRGGERQARRLASIVAGSSDAIIGKNLEGIIESWNAGAELLFGYTADQAIGKPGTMLIPPDRHGEEREVLARVHRGETVKHFTTVRRRGDGGLVDVSLSVSPIFDTRGRVVGTSKIARDITDYVRARERRELLLHEMNHRVKNVFTLAGGLVSLCARTASTPGELAGTVRDRLGALARAHQLTLPDPQETSGCNSKATDLKSLLEIIVSPFEAVTDAGEKRVRFDGPFVEIKGATVTGLALLMHELATNAAKYGALCSHAGLVEVAWSIDGDRLRIIWTETGGPRVREADITEGFGSVLARRTVEGQLHGELAREWNPGGLIARMAIPRNRLG
jgi:PAS domain S-box-containing protein